MSFKIEDDVLVKYDFDHQEETVRIPDGVRVIDKYAFFVCSKVRQIIIPDSVQEIRACAFRECGVASIVIPDSVTVLEQEAFRECRPLSSVVIGRGVTKIEAWMFCGCQDLEHLELPESIESVDYEAFKECYSLHTVWVNGKEYRISDSGAPRPVRLVCACLDEVRESFRRYYESGAMDEFEYIDYQIAGDGYDY